MSRKAPCLFALLLIFSAISSAAYATDQTIFGPTDLKIRRWHFHFSFHRFRLGDPGDGVIIITKKAPDKKIRGGFLVFNRKYVPIRNFLVGSGAVFEKEVSLRPRNRLIVFLRGSPGASITIEIRRKSPVPPPEVTFWAEPQSIIVGNSSTLTWQTDNADSCIDTTWYRQR